MAFPSLLAALAHVPPYLVCSPKQGHAALDGQIHSQPTCSITACTPGLAWLVLKRNGRLKRCLARLASIMEAREVEEQYLLRVKDPAVAEELRFALPPCCRRLASASHLGNHACSPCNRGASLAIALFQGCVAAAGTLGSRHAAGAARFLGQRPAGHVPVGRPLIPRHRAQPALGGGELQDAGRRQPGQNLRHRAGGSPAARSLLQRIELGMRCTAVCPLFSVRPTRSSCAAAGAGSGRRAGLG